MMSETLKRTLSALVMVTLLVGCFYMGPPYSLGLVGVISLLVMGEWAVLSFKILRAHFSFGRILFVIFGTIAYAISLFTLVIFLLILVSDKFPSPQELEILPLFGFVWLVDIGAYFTGRYFGGKKLAPSISPGKTWSGFFGGVVFGSLGAYVFFFFDSIPDSNLNFLYTVIFFFASMFVQAGDLFESKAKRLAGVKDSSHLIPGHGGVLDRMDSFLALMFFFGAYFLYVEFEELIKNYFM